MRAVAADVAHRGLSLCFCVSATLEQKRLKRLRSRLGRKIRMGPIKEPCSGLGIYGRHLANTIERFVLAGDADCRYH